MGAPLHELTDDDLDDHQVVKCTGQAIYDYMDEYAGDCEVHEVRGFGQENKRTELDPDGIYTVHESYGLLYVNTWEDDDKAWCAAGTASGRTMDLPAEFIVGAMSEID